MIQSDAQKHLEEKVKRRMKYKIRWVVHPHRRDKRTGVINPGPRDKYTQYAFDEIERKFRK